MPCSNFLISQKIEPFCQYFIIQIICMRFKRCDENLNKQKYFKYLLTLFVNNMNIYINNKTIVISSYIITWHTFCVSVLFLLQTNTHINNNSNYYYYYDYDNKTWVKQSYPPPVIDSHAGWLLLYRLRSNYYFSI